MCIAVPYRVIKVMDNGMAQIDFNGTKQDINILMVPDVKDGDFVITYLGSAVKIIEEEEAMEVIRLFQEMTEIDRLLDISSMS